MPPTVPSENPHPVPLFDEYVMVDWSAANRRKRGKDSIWIGRRRDGETVGENVATRAQARERVRELLRDAARAGRRVLVGFDFPYGYPRGFAEALAVAEAQPWLAIWRLLAREIEDDERNQNNRFDVASRLNAQLGREPGPFWGCPPRRVSDSLRPTKPTFPYRGLAEYRAVDLALRERRAATRPLAVWQLMYAGCVGSQALVGIPVVHALRFDPELEAVSGVWPFETGFVPDPGARIVHAEIWPGVIEVEERPGEVRDETQVKTLASAFAGHDAGGTLGALLTPRSADEHTSREEGWILGA
jgi:precorrin-8X/cobalt-precorrin-8 methylmutase